MKEITRRSILAAAPAALALAAIPARAAKNYGPGVTDTEIKIGNTGPYSGPASSYGTIAKSEAAYFRLVNDEGGVNGRKIDFISYDDAYSPPKTVEQVRKLVEQDGVLLVMSPLGTPTNSAIWRYMNQKKVPQLFVATGATKWNDPKGHPWTMGWQPNYQSEGHAYAAYILQNKPDGKVAVLYQNDDFGKDYLKGLKDGLGGKAGMVILAAPYETTDPTVDSQIISMKAAGADVFVNTGIPKFAAQAIKKAAEIEWKPLHILSSSATRSEPPSNRRGRRTPRTSFPISTSRTRPTRSGRTIPAISNGLLLWTNIIRRATRATPATSSVRRSARRWCRC